MEFNVIVYLSAHKSVIKTCNLHRLTKRNTGRSVRMLTLFFFTFLNYGVQSLLGCTAMSHHPDDGGSTYLWNVGRHLFDYTAVHPRILWSSQSPPWEPKISLLELELIKPVPSTVIQIGPSISFWDNCILLSCHRLIITVLSLVTCFSANFFQVSSYILEPKGTRVCAFCSNYGSGTKRDNSAYNAALY
jgi:hypothetical protein